MVTWEHLQAITQTTAHGDVGAIPERIPLKSIDPKSHRPWSIDNIIGVKQGVKDRQLDMKRLGLVKVARNRFCHYFVNCHV
jgi:hypothetical protein